ncbi:MAG: hypothetical protein LKI53_04255 [Bacteroidales bacterium]|nr:hypothetical protein [Bacteroidales bacterium]
MKTEDDKRIKKDDANFIVSFFGGKFLNIKILPFIIYCFALAIIYITLNLKATAAQLQMSKNERTLVNLKADYTSKAAQLEARSKRGEVEARLKALGSSVKAPKEPAREVAK